ncbi:MAG TPA: hypothetical protein VFD35_12560 [Pricia sp.]|nr:hypothetical protein [Pricia sp.]
MTYKFQILDAADRDIRETIGHYERVRKGLSMDFELCLDERLCRYPEPAPWLPDKVQGCPYQVH